MMEKGGLIGIGKVPQRNQHQCPCIIHMLSYSQPHSTGCLIWTVTRKRTRKDTKVNGCLINVVDVPS